MKTIATISAAAAASLLLSAALPAHAAQPDAPRPTAAKSPTCQAFSDVIENALKLIDMNTAKAAGDNSVPRNALAAGESANLWQQISINLALARENGCPAPSTPIEGGRYLIQAMKCQTEMLKLASGASTETEARAACSQRSWKPES